MYQSILFSPLWYYYDSAKIMYEQMKLSFLEYFFL